MTKLSKFKSIVILLLFLQTTLFSVSISIKYNKTAKPGDAIVITLELSDGIHETFSSHAELYVKGNSKTLVKADLYKISTNNYSAIVPLSAWYHADDYYIDLFYQFKNTEQKKVQLPIEIATKQFLEETIYLDKQNTDIKTDTSPKRVAQIDSFQELINSVDKNAVYHTQKFDYPIETVYHTGNYGDRRLYKYEGTNTLSSSSMHNGTDYRAAIGTPIFSCARGKVVMAEERISSGLTVILEHLPGCYSMYYHLDSIDATLNSIIEQGEIIGKAGDTGLATGPHLHWELRILGYPVNPEFFLQQALAEH